MIAIKKNVIHGTLPKREKNLGGVIAIINLSVTNSLKQLVVKITRKKTAA